MGPLLFSIYLNDLLWKSEKVPSFELESFADDTIAYAVKSTPEDAVNDLNIGLEFVINWLDTNRLPLNIKKSKGMLIISERSRLARCPHTDLQIRFTGDCLEQTDSVLHPGVWINRFLRWEKQFQRVGKNVAYGIAKLNRAKRGLSQYQRVELYHALIESHLTYCCTVWSATLNSLREKLAVLQRKAPRYHKL